MQRRIAVRAVILYQGKLLCVRLRPKADAPKNGTFWCTPGGGLDQGEALTAVLEREMLEETGVRPRIGNLLYIQQFHDGKAEQLEFLFHVENAADYANIDLAATTHGVKEIAELEFVDPAAVHLLPTFLAQTNIGADIAAGKTKYFNNL